MQDIDLERRQLAWGRKAANDWIKLNGYMPVSHSVEEASLPTFVAMREDAEVMIEVITQTTLFTSGAREAMHRTSEWKQENPGHRTTGVFVPEGYGANAKEVLGLYDFFVEYGF